MKITVDNFQSLGHVEVEAEGLTVLVGPSDRGKSALVRAIEATLFNRPGDTFVRTGAKTATVAITGLPAVDGSTHEVRWEKGKTSNAFTIDGAKHAKVGKSAPQPLQDFGYRDVYVGDKDRKDGEWVRPQVATQFEPLFLLTRAGSFIADVLNLVTRHAVLQTAVGRAATDLGRQKSAAGTVRRMLDDMEPRGQALEGVPAFVGRVKALRARANELRVAREELERLRVLAARRQAFQHVERLPMGVQDPDVLDRVAQVVGFIAATRRRGRLTPVTAAPLPAQVETGQVHEQVARRQWLHKLAYDRATLAAIPVDFPKDREPFIPIVAEGLALRDMMRPLQAKLLTALTKSREADLSLDSTDTLLIEAGAELAMFKDETKICPVCETPWSGV